MADVGNAIILDDGPPLPVESSKRASPRRSGKRRRKKVKNPKGRTCIACQQPWAGIIGHLAYRGEKTTAIRRYLVKHFKPLGPPSASTISLHMKHSEVLPQMPAELALIERQTEEPTPGIDPIDLRAVYVSNLEDIDDTLSRIKTEETETGSVNIQKRYFLDQKQKTAANISAIDVKMAELGENEDRDGYRMLINALNSAAEDGGNTMVLNMMVIELIRLAEGEDSANRVLLLSGGNPEL